MLNQAPHHPLGRHPRDFHYHRLGRPGDLRGPALGVRSAHQGFYAITGRTDIEFGEVKCASWYRPNIRMVDRFGEGRVFVAGGESHYWVQGLSYGALTLDIQTRRTRTAWRVDRG